MVDISDLIRAIKDSDTKTGAYDTTATVRRVEGKTAWVHIPGGQDETPVNMTVNAQAGDTVQVRVSGGSAFLVGNASAPPTDDSTAIKVEQKVGIVEKVVTTVRELAETAVRIAGNTRQYFWFTSEGNDTGAHITEKPQDEFLADPANGGGNLLARSNGIAVRDGTTELATFSENTIEIGKNSLGAEVSLVNGTFFMGVESGTSLGHRRASLSSSFVYDGTDETENTWFDISTQNSINGQGVKQSLIRLSASKNLDTSAIYAEANSINMDTLNINNWIQMRGSLRVTGSIYENGKQVYGQTSTTTWTAPTPYSSRCTIESGGYFKEGKHLYIEVSVKLASALSAGSALQMMSISGNVPVISRAPLMVASDSNYKQHTGVAVEINGNTYLIIKANETISTTETLYLYGHYVTA